MKTNFDIDIDFPDRSKILEILKHRVAILENGRPHNSGVYFTDIPHNPLTNRATIDYKDADRRGYFKIDLLNVNIYQSIKDNNHLEELMNKEPIWDLLEHGEFVDQVFHLNGHSGVLKTMRPRTIEQLAAVLAIIRPAKRHLVGKSWNDVMSEVWIKPSNGDYYFKKAHAISYSMAVVVHMNLICEQLVN